MNLFDFPKDVIVYIALTMDLPEIWSLCSTNSRFNLVICQNQDFWRNRLKQDYDVTSVPNNKTPKEYYEYIHKNMIFINNQDKINSCLSILLMSN